MAPRAHWKGYLKLSLVSCAVALYTATSTSERVRFHMLNRQTGHRLRQRYVDALTGEPVEPEDRTRGYEVGKDDYVAIEDDEIEQVEIESTRTIAVEQFVARDEIDPLYYDAAYFIAPDDRVAVEAYSVIREAMARTGTVGIARAVLHRRERILMVAPRGRGLVAMALRYHYEVRSSDTIFEDIPDVALDEETMALAQSIVDRKRAPFRPEQFEDRYESALVALVRSKQAGRPAPTAQPQARPSNVINLVEALRRSVEAEGAPPEKPAKPPRLASPPTAPAEDPAPAKKRAREPAQPSAPARGRSRGGSKRAG